MQPNLFIFIIFLFEKFTSVERVYRQESMKLWQELLKNMPPKNADKMPDNPKLWISEYYVSRRGDKSIFKRMAKIQFEEEKKQNDKNNDFDRK